MKIDKIQCDICGKMVDYNDERIRDTIFESTSPSISRDYYEKFKANRFVLRGITKMKNINKIDNSELDVTINIENDLCEDCLVELRKMINKWKEERKMSFLVDNYVYRLYNLVQNGGENHRKLCVELFKNRFFITRSAPKRDIDREKDGLELRKTCDFCYDNVFESEMSPIPCTMLEMIIGISKRMSEQLMDEDGEDKTSQYFWEIIGNLGLKCWDDDNFGWETGLASKNIEKICEILCKRQYNPDGTGGGMFPMPGVLGINQKKMEIWYQMQEYINWKYRIKWV